MKKIFGFKAKLYLLLTLLSCCVLSTSCRHETELSTIPELSFSGRVQPIIQSNCAKAGCHAVGGSQISLNTYSEISKKIKAGKPHQSELYKTMIYLDDYRVMPPPPDKPLTEDQLQIVFTWIAQGAKNN